MDDYQLFFKTIYGITIIICLAYLWTLASELVCSIMATIKHYGINKIPNAEKEKACDKKGKKTKEIKTIRKISSTALQENFASAES
ncbi:MAG: hypothetical protein KAW52_00800 [candidate division Zixibacteria bacterium]|nr:hypothetical protein [candidate division Zixibacteria bacterium]